MLLYTTKLTIIHKKFKKQQKSLYFFIHVCKYIIYTGSNNGIGIGQSVQYKIKITGVVTAIVVLLQLWLWSLCLLDIHLWR